MLFGDPPPRSRPGSTASSAGPPRPPRAGASRVALRGHRPGFVPVRSVRRRCRLPRAPCSALRPALLFAIVQAAPSPPAACCARPPTAPAVPPATHTPRRLPSAGFTGVDSPLRSYIANRALTGRGRSRFSHPTQQAAGARLSRAWRALAGTCGAVRRHLVVGMRVLHLHAQRFQGFSIRRDPPVLRRFRPCTTVQFNAYYARLASVFGRAGGAPWRRFLEFHAPDCVIAPCVRWRTLRRR